MRSRNFQFCDRHVEPELQFRRTQIVRVKQDREYVGAGQALCGARNFSSGGLCFETSARLRGNSEARTMRRRLPRRGVI